MVWLLLIVGWSRPIADTNNNACYGAPLLFVLAAKHGSQFAERDAYVAAENIMVEATSLVLGSV